MASYFFKKSFSFCIYHIFKTFDSEKHLILYFFKITYRFAEVNKQHYWFYYQLVFQTNIAYNRPILMQDNKCLVALLKYNRKLPYNSGIINFTKENGY